MNATLQSLRFVFVMMIFMSHFAYRGFTPFDAGGDCGVAFFFLLSGFTMSMGYGRSIADGSFRFSRYLKRRLLKVYPLHLLCLFLFLALFRPTLDGTLPINALLLQSWIPDSAYYFSYNGVSWFLSSLLFSYLLFPIAYRKGNSLVLDVLLLCCLAVYVIVPYDRINALLYVSPQPVCSQLDRAAHCCPPRISLVDISLYGRKAAQCTPLLVGTTAPHLRLCPSGRSRFPSVAKQDAAMVRLTRYAHLPVAPHGLPRDGSFLSVHPHAPHAPNLFCPGRSPQLDASLLSSP